MEKSVKQCQNCHNNFTVETEDFDFYAKIKIPAPTFCPWCRFIRRTMFRNERVLYRRKCDLCQADMITIFAPEKSYKVYCNKCWWSDGWDALEYGQDYDPRRNFFEQFKELQEKVPYPPLITDYPSLVNSDYVNFTGTAKNCYLIFDSDFCENVHYSTTPTHDRDSMDSLLLDESELCYEVVNCESCFKVFFSEDCLSSQDIYFSKNLSGCSNCFGCVNLRNKSYHIWNEPHTKEDYFKKLKDFKLDSFKEIEKLRGEALSFWLKFPQKYMHGHHNKDVSGDYVHFSKNTKFSYQVGHAEDSKFCQRISIESIKDCYDYFEWGMNAQRIYDCVTVGDQADNVRFSFFIKSNVRNIDYSIAVFSSSDLFGCIGLRKRKYCILNKQYEKDDYEKLREKIINDMNVKPYIDAKGRIFKYGEFFPYDLSLFDYNESTAAQYKSLTKDEIEENDWRWRDPAKIEYQVTMYPDKMSDSINDAPESIINEILQCDKCGRAYRVIKPELDLLKRFGFPLPRKCSECRHLARLERMSKPKFWSQKCGCGGLNDDKGVYKNAVSHFHGNEHCPNEFQTSYAPERPEIVYCENCYQAEVV